MNKNNEHELTIEIYNKSPAKLRRLVDWIDIELYDWSETDELPMKGTDWSFKLDGEEL